MSAELYPDDSTSSSTIRRKKTALLITALLFFSALLVWFLPRDNQAFPQIPDTLLFQGIDGNTSQWSAYRGQPVVVKFWATTCVICMQQLDEWKQFYRSVDPALQFEILALAMYHDRPDDVIEVSRHRGLPYPVFLDLMKQASLAFGNVIATPTTFLINREGQVVKRYLGRLDFEQLSIDLQQLT